jgi:hypothetical protein
MFLDDHSDGPAPSLVTRKQEGVVEVSAAELMQAWRAAPLAFTLIIPYN